MVIFPYKVKDNAPENISRYAAVPDYHIICGEYLEKIKENLQKSFPKNQFEYFIDNSPVPEVYAASVAGLGMIGENGLLINEKYGSFVFIGEILTDIEIFCENKVQKCENCGKCKAVCPVDLQKSECLSAVTQQKRELDENQKRLLAENRLVWGCDICQNACPHNKNAQKTYIEKFSALYRNRFSSGESPDLRPYCWRGAKYPERNLNIIEEK